MIACPSCRKELPGPLAFCPACGQPTGLVPPRAAPPLAAAPRPAAPPPATRPAVAKPFGATLHPLLGQRFHDTAPGPVSPASLARSLDSQPPEPALLARDLPLDRRTEVARAAVPPTPARPPLGDLVPPPAAAQPALVEPSRPEAAVCVRTPSDDAEGVARRARVAPGWRRLGSWLVDGAVLVGLAALFLGLAASLVHHGPSSRQTGLDWLAETTLAYRRLWGPGAGLVGLLAFAYEALFTALGGQTPGKRAFGLRVVDRHGLCPSPLRAAGRAVASLASGFAACAGLLLALVDGRGQALHDKLAGTFVVVGPVGENLSPSNGA